MSSCFFSVVLAGSVMYTATTYDVDTVGNVTYSITGNVLLHRFNSMLSQVMCNDLTET